MNIKSHFILSEAKKKVLKSFCSFDIQQDNVEISISTDHHHISVIKLNVCWCVWKGGEGFPDRV